MITDGYSNVNPEKTPEAAAFLRQDGVKIYVIAAGESPNFSEINAIASEPLNTYVLPLQNENEVSTKAAQLINSLCSLV